MAPKKLVLGLPKGSLQEMTFDLMRKAGFSVHLASRSYQPVVDDPELDPLLVRPQEIPRYVQDGVLDCGIAGRDWVKENKAKVVEMTTLRYSKVSHRPVRWVLAVPEASGVGKPSQLKGKRVSTELVETTKDYFRKKKIRVAKVEFSWGATEVKPPRFCDAIVEATETGSSLRANGLRILDVVTESFTVLVAGKAALKDAFKKRKLEQMTLLFDSVMNAAFKVVLKMNVPRARLNRVMSLLPALKSPTISQLSDPRWIALETVVEEKSVRDLLPKLRQAGAEGLLEFPLNKVCY